MISMVILQVIRLILLLILQNEVKYAALSVYKMIMKFGAAPQKRYFFKTVLAT